MIILATCFDSYESSSVEPEDLPTRETPPPPKYEQQLTPKQLPPTPLPNTI